MTPRLYAADATTFTTNGIGALSEAISCTVTEELDGIYELSMSYPLSGRLYSELATSKIIVVQPYEGASEQAFRVYKISTPLSGRVNVYAQHISYQLNWIPVMPFEYSSLADCFEKLMTYSATDNPFTLWTNKEVATGHSFDTPRSFRACLGGQEGSVLQKYGGDFEWDNYTVKLWLRRGADNGVRIAYGKNLIDAQQETNIEETYTGVCPYWTNEETNTTVTLSEKYILADTASLYPFERIQTVDFSEDFEDEPTEAQLRARTETYINANNIGYPNISIDVDFVALWQSEEYKDIAPLEQVQLGDTVTVDIERLGISTTARVIEYTYDVLKERYRSIVVGNEKSSFSKTFVSQGQAIEASLKASKSYTGKAVASAKSYTDGEVGEALEQAAETAEELVENATSWLTASGGYVVAVKNDDNSWKELLFLDSPSTTTAQTVLRINENGLGFSQTGVDGPYTQAWTLDGKLVIGGTDDVTLSAVDGNGSEIFGVDQDGIRWVLDSSIMTKNGTLYFLGSGAGANSGNVLRLNNRGISFSKNGYNGTYSQSWYINGQMTLGGYGNKYGSLKILDVQGREIISASSDAFILYGYDSSGNQVIEHHWNDNGIDMYEDDPDWGDQSGGVSQWGVFIQGGEYQYRGVVQAGYVGVEDDAGTERAVMYVDDSGDGHIEVNGNDVLTGSGVDWVGFVDGAHLTFENGILVDAYET